MTYQDIIRRTAANLSIVSISTVFIAAAKRDMYDIVNKITSKVRFLKAVNSEDITDASGTLVLEDDFFLPVEVVFKNSDDHQFVSAEMLRETYEKWTPNVAVITTSFVELVTSATPNVYVWTQENEDLDGKVGYTFTETHPRSLIWKPLVNGSVTIIYAVYDDRYDTAVDPLGNSPKMHKVYHELIVLGMTLKFLVRKLMSKDLTEVLLIALNASIKRYEKEYNEMMGDFTAYADKKATFEVQRMQPFNFLTDPNMLL